MAILRKILACKKAKCLHSVLLGKAKKQHFQKFVFKEIMENKDFWNPVTPLLTIKSVQENAPVSLEIKNETVIKEQKLVQESNFYNTNIVQNTTGTIHSKLGAIFGHLMIVK